MMQSLGRRYVRYFNDKFVYHVEGELLEEIRNSTNKGMAIGNDRFKEEIERVTGRRLKEKNGAGLLVGERLLFNFTLTPFEADES